MEVRRAGIAVFARLLKEALAYSRATGEPITMTPTVEEAEMMLAACEEFVAEATGRLAPAAAPSAPESPAALRLVAQGGR